MPIEVKSRVSHQSENDAIASLKQHLGVSCPPMLGQHKVFIQLDSTRDASTLHQLLLDQSRTSGKDRHMRECIQLLHHVFVYGATAGLLLIGNNVRLIYAIEVSFSDDLLMAYNQVTKFIFEKYFHFFYESSLDDFPVEKIEVSLELRNESKQKKNEIDMHSFWCNYQLWRALNVNVNEAIIRFPLPPCSRIIPIQCSWWNSTKGPSDTTTKLLDNCEEQLGVRTPQTIAVARLLGIAGVVFHRCNQILSGRDCSSYPSANAYRGAANKRAPFWKSLVTLCEFIGGESSFLKEKQKPPPPPQQVLTPVTPRQQVRTRKGSKIQAARWTEMKTGNTPKLGRKNKSEPHKAVSHALRGKKCLGVTLVSRVDTRGKCKMCGQKTFYYCTGCKNSFCFQTGGDCGEKIKKMMKNKTIGKTNIPPLFYNLTERSKDGTKNTKFKFRNSCYHIAHAEQVEKYFETKASENKEDEEENATP